MRNLAKYTLLFCFFLFGAARFSDAVAAQGWRMFIDDVKREADDKRKNERETEQENAVPASVSASADDLNSNDENQTDGGSESEPPTARGVRTPVSRGGLLDFSNALVDDAAEVYGDAENEPPPVSNGVYAPNLPSYRDFPQMKNDARLNDVCFVSPSNGWVVGDRGTIWSTVDGGATWRLADIPTDANLFAVSFLDENFGLAVGGRILPSARVGRGVILRTVDGGASWGEIETAAFPILRDVKILDEGTAWIAGDSSELYSSGLFASSDSGLTWETIPGNKRAGWKSILFDPTEKIGVGTTTEGAFQTVDGSTAAKKALPIGTRRLRDVAFDGSTGTAWLVGEGGFTNCSTDFGVNWARTPGSLPNGAERYFDFESVAAVGGFVGAIGTPGTLFFYSNDGGNVWNASPTGTKAPLRKLFFLDRENGWAVGDLGTIVATVDGGKTWNVLRSGASRAALLGIFGRAQDVPLEPFVQLAGDEGFISEVCLVAREAEKESVSSEIPIFERLNEALVETGASGATQSGLFLLDSAALRFSLEQILERFDRENDGDGLERFREYLVRQLRIWRPSVLLTVDSLENSPEIVANVPADADFKSPQGTRTLLGALSANAATLDARPRDAFRALILRELPFAIQSAGDPTVYPEHFTACGLEPWNVSKVRVVCLGKTQGDLLLDASYFCATLGRPVGEISKNARELVFSEENAAFAVETTNFQTLFGANLIGSNDSASKSFFAGITIPKGSDARRATQAGLLESFDVLSARAGDRRQKLGIVDATTIRNPKNRKSGELLLSQLRGNIQNSDEDFAIEYISRAGRNFASLGNWPAAEEAFSLVALEFPNAPKNREALTWLIQYYCGSEPRLQTQETNRVNETTTTLKSNEELTTKTPELFAGSDGGTQKSRSTLALEEEAVGGARLVNAARLGDAIRDAAPETYMSPEIRFPLAAAQRARGDLDGALRFYLNRAIASRADLWGARAQAEYWLATPNRNVLPNDEKSCPFANAFCRFAASRPYLDGEFEPVFWDSASKFALTSPLPEFPPTRELDENEKAALNWREENRRSSTDFGTTVSILCDSEFLYLGVVCPKSSAFKYPGGGDFADASDAEQPRPRDADLATLDRVEFEIDLDGDYSTSYQFAFDCRGWVADSLWGDVSWNPQLFVAKKDSNADWRLEIAIPLESIAPRTPRRGDVWRFAARRVVPGVGVECWNVENSERGEKAFGFLTFGD